MVLQSGVIPQLYLGPFSKGFQKCPNLGPVFRCSHHVNSGQNIWYWTPHIGTVYEFPISIIISLLSFFKGYMIYLAIEKLLSEGTCFHRKYILLHPERIVCSEKTNLYYFYIKRPIPTRRELFSPLVKVCPISWLMSWLSSDKNWRTVVKAGKGWVSNDIVLLPDYKIWVTTTTWFTYPLCQGQFLSLAVQWRNTNCFFCDSDNILN